MSEIQNKKRGGALAPHFHMHMIICYVIIVAIIVLDQMVKALICLNMEPGQTIAVIERVFHLTYVQNRGAAFSIWQQQWIMLILLPAVALAAGLILIYIKRSRWSRCMLVSIALICGGGIGNLIDRVANGYVVDMFDCRFIPFIDFPVFNIADIFICVGCGLLILDVVFLEKEEKEEKR